MHEQTLKFYRSITGSLSKPSKMPGRGYGLPALTSCRTGSILAQVEGTTCSHCYACRGNYRFPAVKAAQQRRLEALDHPRWEESMIKLIGRLKEPYFRWHDSGDLQSVEHLMKLDYIARALPRMQFWLPTHERGIVNEYQDTFGPVSKNLVIRLSSAKIDVRPPKTGLCTSSVHRHAEPFGYACPASKQDNSCGDCRACWDPSVKNVSYKFH